jgi:hypothetical protein
MSAFGQHLGQRDRDVARAGRKVAQQDVQLPPVDIGQELLDRTVQHRTTPDHGAVGVGEEPDRDHLAAVRLERHHHAVERHRLAGHAEHPGDRVAPDVRVEHPDPETLLRQGGRQVHGDGRLADAALA